MADHEYGDAYSLHQDDGPRRPAAMASRVLCPCLSSLRFNPSARTASGTGPMNVSALLDVTSIARQDDRLTLTGPGSELHFELLPLVPTAELTDTLWELESLIEGSGPDGVGSSAFPAGLTLSSDGSVTGSTGCRRLEGKWVENGDEILFTELSAEGNCQDELERQDEHVVTVLGDGFTAEIDGRTLTLFSAGELGLVYRAASEN
jgi:heat shock protein HslJ